MIDALVIGSGPAGLMAAEALAAAGRRVTIAEAKPSAGRKLLMAGKSGLNLTRDEPDGLFRTRYGDRAEALQPMLNSFGKQAVVEWAKGLGQDVFTGSTGRVFPKSMKASPLLRAWLSELGKAGVALQTRWRWVAWDADGFRFDTPDGVISVKPAVTVLALGGASWPRLGSDASWVNILAEQGVEIAPLSASNAGITINWSPHMARHFGAPIKGVALSDASTTDRGEFSITDYGIEGGGAYGMNAAVRTGQAISLDLLPDRTPAQILERLSATRSKDSLKNRLRKALKLDVAKLALLSEFAHPLPTGEALANAIKNLPVPYVGLQPVEQAISTAGGVAWNGLDQSLMLKALPGVFTAGEMLDWDAPTGGYLLTASLATGKWAGEHAAKWGAVA